MNQTIANPPAQPHFRLPNARAGQLYQGPLKITGVDTPAAVRLRNMLVPPGLGLMFDEAQQCLLGTPLLAGEYEMTLEWSRDGSTWHGGKCPLIVIADPRSLWKVLEPPADAPYRKPHTATQMLRSGQQAALNGDASAAEVADRAAQDGGEWALLAASRRGRSHEHAGTFRDDDFFIAHDQASGWSVMLVADGAGSAKSSREGARLAVQVAGAHLLENLGSLPPLDGADAEALNLAFAPLFHAAATCALAAIEAEAALQQQIPRDFVTTLLAACVRQHGAQTLLATFGIGDGAIAAYGPRGQVRLMGQPDSGEYAGQTRFLDRACLAAEAVAGSDAPPFAARVSTGCFSGLNAVLLMTDGVSDPRFETGSGLHNAGKWDALWDELALLLASGDPQQSLLDWLHFFTPGHHDDRTLVLWYPPAAVSGGLVTVPAPGSSPAASPPAAASPAPSHAAAGSPVEESPSPAAGAPV